MTDNDDFDKVDEDFASEFDFVDTEPGSEPPLNNNGTGGGNPQNPEPPKAVQTIVSLIVLIAIIAGGYYAYKFFFGNKPEKTKEATTPVTSPASTTSLPQPEAPATTTANVPEADQNEIDFSDIKPEELSDALPGKSFSQVQQDMQKQQKSATAAVPVDIRNVLQSLNEEMTTNVNNIKQLETTITSLTVTVEQLNKVVGAMDNRVLGLTETVESLSQDLANVKKVMVDEDIDLANPGTIKFSNKKTTPPIGASAANYTVHAIIPGRAWLKSSNGQIITVTEGDKIGDYGTVATIDATNGIVRTSSGIILK